MSGILSGDSILQAVESGDIEITPFDPKQLNPVSYDLRLGEEVAVYDDLVLQEPVGPKSPEDGRHFLPHSTGVLDAKKEPKVSRYKIPERGWLLLPGIGYLMHTHERICAKKHVPILDGKSSIGRLFLAVHATAGFGDPGFDGQYTLEVTVKHPVRVYAGMRICQIRFHGVDGKVRSYQEFNSSYKGALAVGPVPSQAWKMFR